MITAQDIKDFGSTFGGWAAIGMVIGRAWKAWKSDGGWYGFRAAFLGSANASKPKPAPQAPSVPFSPPKESVKPQ